MLVLGERDVTKGDKQGLELLLDGGAGRALSAEGQEGVHDLHRADGRRRGRIWSGGTLELSSALSHFSAAFLHLRSARSFFSRSLSVSESCRARPHPQKQREDPRPWVLSSSPAEASHLCLADGCKLALGPLRLASLLVLHAQPFLNVALQRVPRISTPMERGGPPREETPSPPSESSDGGMHHPLEWPRWQTFSFQVCSSVLRVSFSLAWSILSTSISACIIQFRFCRVSCTSPAVWPLQPGDS